MVLLCTITGLAFGLWRKQQEVAFYRDAARLMQREVGGVLVRDAERLYCTHQSSRYPPCRSIRYRVYVPAGRTGTVVFELKRGEVGAEKAIERSVARIGPGRSTVELFTSRQTVGEGWNYVLLTGVDQSELRTSVMPPWYDEETGGCGIIFDYPQGGLGAGEVSELVHATAQRSDGSSIEAVLKVSLDASQEAN
ncbi:MAG: hypothetical protein CMJ58_05630 [Planctomycetaceae bacterium]|nr:hypothetical protein [Planctomycetaceae bacterium]